MSAYDRPLKAYSATLPATAEKTILIWANSADEAVRRFYDHDDPNVEVMDTVFFEGKLSRPRRERNEDREPL